MYIVFYFSINMYLFARNRLCMITNELCVTRTDVKYSTYSRVAL